MNIKVLVIEDVFDERELLMNQLKSAGFEVEDAQTGEEGVTKAEANKPELVITDTKMPGIDGFETCKRIKAINGLGAKVIVMTGCIDSFDAQKAKEAGADDYVVKDPLYGDLINAIQKLLKSE